MIMANPQQLLRGMQSIFIEALMEGFDSIVDSVATYVSSDGDHEDYAWLGEVAQVVEFVDEVQFDAPTETEARGFLATNKKFTGGLQVKRDDLNDEKTGGLSQRIRDLAARAMRHADKQLIDLLIAGDATLGYDGDFLFTTTHPVRGKQTAEQSNLLTRTGTSTATAAADLNTAVAALYNMLDEANEPLNEMFRQLFVIYPPAMHKAIAEAVTAGIVAQTTNVQFTANDIKLIRAPRLTADNASNFYVGIMDAPVRGLIYQDREPVTFEALETGDLAFVKEVYSYKVRKRSIAIPGRWQRIVKLAA